VGIVSRILQCGVEAVTDMVQKGKAPVSSGTELLVKVDGSKKFDQTMVE
jgi:hypothetical protein